MSPEEVQRVLADFEGWLRQAAPDGPPPAPAAPFDVAGVLGQFVALRQEVNMQTRAVRAQQEQTAALAERLLVAVERPARDEAPRGLLMALVEVYDGLAVAGQQVARVRDGIVPLLQPPPPPPPTFWQRVFGGAPAPAPAGDAAEQARRSLDGLVEGYAMSLQRIERALAKQGVAPLAAVGKAFDAEQMEALGHAEGTGRPAGEVVEEVRRGWTWQGRLLRAAQVRVAR